MVRGPRRDGSHARVDGALTMLPALDRRIVQLPLVAPPTGPVPRVPLEPRRPARVVALVLVALLVVLGLALVGGGW
jgi:hypothetical protein